MEEETIIQSYQDLNVYKKAYALAIEVYRITGSFPSSELYGLVSQMRRSAVSIPCNIAEGYRRRYIRDYIRFLYIAQGSCGELETLLSISKDLGFIDPTEFDSIYDKQEVVARLLRGLISSLSRKSNDGG